ncbi:Amine oxidase,FAD/NAD(P)-binding domain [Cinara cedri]|uniref:Amine oxidase,FAD/NAD(P)-binding domain n=1 Tax=Cinara cedri TaxID=506608 RepID=A0A5E4NL33_9HEMI|nr:Amine oxidase,FAD/NAD(P)-binding domain [Cinara cedri]
MKVLLIGCGLTSTATAYLLRARIPNIHLTVWEKARGPGGRASVRRGPKGISVDLGVQFITTDSSALSKYSVIYEQLISTKTLTPMDCKIEGLSKSNNQNNHFIAPNGTNSLVKYFLNNANVDCIEFERRVSAITSSGKVISICGSEEFFDLIIITVPAPQILQMECPMSQLVRNELEKVTYSTRFTFNMFYEKPIIKEEWDVKFLDDKTFRYVSIDNRKRGQYDAPDSVIFHTTKEFGETHVTETRESAYQMLFDKVNELFPDWPSPELCNVHKWLYSQVVNSYSNSPGCVILNESIPIIAGGDCFTQSNFNGCLESAYTICETIENLKI